jgi:hypothetical protein
LPATKTAEEKVFDNFAHVVHTHNDGGKLLVLQLALGDAIAETRASLACSQSAAVKTLGEKRWSAILSDLETAALALKKTTN